MFVFFFGVSSLKGGVVSIGFTPGICLDVSCPEFVLSNSLVYLFYFLKTINVACFCYIREVTNSHIDHSVRLISWHATFRLVITTDLIFHERASTLFFCYFVSSLYTRTRCVLCYCTS